MSDVTQDRGSQASRDSRAGEGVPEFEGYWGRRFLAICIDWVLASAISAGFFAYDQMATLAVFGAMTFVLVGTAGTTLGHRICGVGMRTLQGGLPGPLRGLARTVGVLLVIPAVVTDPAGRSLHDRWSGTQVVRL